MPDNPESILDSVKKALGFASDYEAFDIEIIMHTNTAFGSLQQLGVGPSTGFSLVDNSLLWSDYTSNIVLLAAVKSYIYLKVRLIFDPPSTSFAIESLTKIAAELEWRLNVMAESIDAQDTTGGDVVAAFWWDLTDLSDFPAEAAVGDLGIDMTTGDVWRKA